MSGTPSANPDNHAIFIVDSGTGSILETIRPHGLEPWFGITWSPDGRSIAFDAVGTGGDLGAAGIYVVDASGEGLHLATACNAFETCMDSQPAWSPDGKQIAFTRTGQERGSDGMLRDIYFLFVDTGEVRPVTSGDGLDCCPSWQAAEGEAAPAPEAEAGDAFAVWPVDTPEEADFDDAKAVMSTPEDVARAFAAEVLEWSGTVTLGEPGHGGPATYLATRGEGPEARLYVGEVLDGSFAVAGVESGPAGLGLDVDARSGRARIGFERLGASTVEVRIGYGTGPAAYTETITREDVTSVTFDLSGRFDLTGPGHLLLLFMERVFAAKGIGLPAGDFAAG